ncbi:MAG TPA: UbiA family prenyltransferase [Patescibacteria group bacterium]|nr:UbiA family prenyltransferase [Patescibacteria group bacterium]
MIRYVRLLRLQDQYIQIGSVFAGALFSGLHVSYIWQWMFSLTLISCAAFVLNEWVDRNDTDIHSWNPIHVREKLDKKIVWSLIGGLTLAGLLLSIPIHMSLWAIAFSIATIGYSLPPFRMKNIPILDVLAQVVGWIIIPFLSILWCCSNRMDAVLFSIFLACISWGITYPYVLADYSADLKAKLRGTHVLLGFRPTLFLTIIFIVVGNAGLLIRRSIPQYPWVVFFSLLSIVSAFLCIRWLRISSRKTSEEEMQRYSRFMKPITQLIVPVFFVLYFFS